MDIKKARELHDLLFNFMGLFHKKFIIKNRLECSHPAWLKKNHSKIINLLYQNDQLSLTEIAKMLDIEKGSLTTLIDQLEKRNFIQRSTDPTDRRKSLISLSPKGRMEMDRVMNLYAERLNETLSNVDPVEMEEFFSNLKSVVKFMEKV